MPQNDGQSGDSVDLRRPGQMQVEPSPPPISTDAPEPPPYTPGGLCPQCQRRFAQLHLKKQQGLVNEPAGTGERGELS